MKSLTIIAFFVFATTLTTQARADSDPCTPIYEACAAKGFVRDEVAPAGKKIWLDCAVVLIDQKKAVATMDLEPNSWEVTNCRDYQVARKRFDAEWAKTHKSYNSIIVWAWMIGRRPALVAERGEEARR